MTSVFIGRGEDTEVHTEEGSAMIGVWEDESTQGKEC